LPFSYNMGEPIADNSWRLLIEKGYILVSAKGYTRWRSSAAKRETKLWD
jgi:hypothetical protein